MGGCERARDCDYGHIVYQEWASFIRVQWVPVGVYDEFMEKFRDEYGEAEREVVFWYKTALPVLFNQKLVQLFELLFKAHIVVRDECGCVFSISDRSGGEGCLTMTPVDIVRRVVNDLYNLGSCLTKLANEITGAVSGEEVFKRPHVTGTLPFIMRVTHNVGKAVRSYEEILKEFEKELSSDSGSENRRRAELYTDIDVTIRVPEDCVIGYESEHIISARTLIEILKAAFEYFPKCDFKTYPSAPYDGIYIKGGGEICVSGGLDLRLTLPQAIGVLGMVVKDSKLAEYIYETLIRESLADENKMRLDETPMPYDPVGSCVGFASLDCAYVFENMFENICNKEELRKISDADLERLIPGKVCAEPEFFKLLKQKGVGGVGTGKQDDKNVSATYSIRLEYNRCTHVKSVDLVETSDVGSLEIRNCMRFIENVEICSTPVFKAEDAFRVMRYIDSMIGDDLAIEQLGLNGLTNKEKASVFQLLSLYFSESCEVESKNGGETGREAGISDLGVSSICSCALCSSTAITSVDQKTVIQHLVESLALKSETVYVMSSEIQYHIVTYINEINSHLPVRFQIPINNNQISQHLSEYLERKRRAVGMTFAAKLPSVDEVKGFAKDTAGRINEKMVMPVANANLAKPMHVYMRPQVSVL